MTSATLNTDADLLHRARRRVGLKMGFAGHATIFVLVNLGLFALHSASGGARGLPFPLWGWGLGLAIHGLVTLLKLQGEGLRDRLLAGEVARLQRRG